MTQRSPPRLDQAGAAGMGGPGGGNPFRWPFPLPRLPSGLRAEEGRRSRCLPEGHAGRRGCRIPGRAQRGPSLSRQAPACRLLRGPRSLGAFQPRNRRHSPFLRAAAGPGGSVRCPHAFGGTAVLPGLPLPGLRQGGRATGQGSGCGPSVARCPPCRRLRPILTLYINAPGYRSPLPSGHDQRTGRGAAQYVTSSWPCPDAQASSFPFFQVSGWAMF